MVTYGLNMYIPTHTHTHTKKYTRTHTYTHIHTHTHTHTHTRTHARTHTLVANPIRGIHVKYVPYACMRSKPILCTVESVLFW